MPAVAEGIETSETIGLLASRGCEYGQGYLFSKAMSAAQADTILAGQSEPVSLRAEG